MTVIATSESNKIRSPNEIELEIVRIDSQLSNCGVQFLPWIGKKYQRGYKQRRLLILGESHYSKWHDKGVLKNHRLSPTFTRQCVEEVKQRYEGPAPFWPYIEQALLQKVRVGGWAPGGDKIWDQIAFYNFVQTPVDIPNTSPSRKQFHDSHPAFKAVIEALRPQRVIVCGSRLWKGMPATAHDNGKLDLFLRTDIQGYRLDDGTPIWCLVINHPSRAFRWSKWHYAISAFLSKPEKAVPILSTLR